VLPHGQKYVRASPIKLYGPAPSAAQYYRARDEVKKNERKRTEILSKNEANSLSVVDLQQRFRWSG
jgi:hypothetical protein